MSKVTLEGYILVPESDLQRVKQVLTDHIRLTLEEPGCISFRVTQSPLNPLRFEVYEEFRDRAAFERHQERVRSSGWGSVSLNLERHYSITE